MTPTATDRLKLGLLLILAGFLALSLLLIARPRTQVWGALFNGSHVIVALALALATQWVAATWWPALSQRRRYQAAFAVTIAAGAALELAQLVAPGEASWSDLLRDAAGAAAGLLLHGAYARRRRMTAAWLVLGAVLIMTPALWPSLRVLRRQARIVRQLPAVAAFEGAGEAAEVRVMDGARLVLAEPPRPWSQARRARVGKVTFQAGAGNPRILLNNPFADWSPYRTLVFTAYSAEKVPFELTIRIDDMAATLAMSDRFHRQLTVMPGPNIFRIPLDDVRRSPETRELDLGALENVVLFMHQPRRDHILFVERFWLE